MTHSGSAFTRWSQTRKSRICRRETQWMRQIH